MKKGQVVLQHTLSKHRWGVVLSTRIDKTYMWKYCKVQWTSPGSQVLGDPEREEEVRIDEISAVDVMSDFESIQKAISLSAATKDKNYAKILKEISKDA